MIVTYKAPSYRPELVAHRYVKRNNDTSYTVYECAAISPKKRGTTSNFDKKLAKIGAGPTLREYACKANELPAWLVERIGSSGTVWKWD